MATKTADSGADAIVSQALAQTLATRFATSLLPAEAAEFEAERLAGAARFTLTAAAKRIGAEPAIAIESISGRSGTPGGERYLRIAVINDDMPFLVDSIAGAISAQGLAIDRLVHPVVAVRRDPEGHLLGLPEGDAVGERRESMVYLETERVDARERRELLAALRLQRRALAQADLAGVRDRLDGHGPLSRAGFVGPVAQDGADRAGDGGELLVPAAQPVVVPVDGVGVLDRHHRAGDGVAGDDEAVDVLRAFGAGPPVGQVSGRDVGGDTDGVSAM